MALVIERGVSQRALDRIWRAAGGEVREQRRTGERFYRWPLTGERSGAYNARKRDASLKLITFVRQCFKGRHAPCAVRGCMTCDPTGVGGDS